MLSIFPELLFLAPFSALLIRVALALVFGYCAWRHIANADNSVRAFGAAEGAMAVTLFLGAWTQPAAIVSMFIIGSWFALPRLRAVALGPALLSFMLGLSLVIMGAGPLAFDLPL